MKYRMLTKEQFSELHPEFINFLASQTISKNEWDTIKKEKPEVAQQELEIFSDLVWEGVLKEVKYLDNSSPQQLFLFKIDEEEMKLIVVKVKDDSKDISTNDGLQWLQNNLNHETVEIFTASKKYSANKNQDIFNLIEQGASISKGGLFEAIHKTLPA